jgi:hypothetical protein
MLEMFKSSVTLFFRGKLFAEPGKAYGQLLIGVLVTVLCLVALARFGEVQLWAAAAIAGFLGGVIQPYLFRNLRYR